MHHYRCNAARVITNNRFTNGARELTQSTGCVLIDRDTLTTWTIDYQGGWYHK